MRKRLLMPGDLVAGKYTVKALLGEGGMGAVYLVRHAVTGKRLALKVLHATSKKTTEAEKRLIREAIATGQIEHRNVVNVFDLDEHDGSVFLVMEYLEGRTLKQMFVDRSLTDYDFVEIMLRAMEGVKAAHELGVVHRDLKPDNIFVVTGPSGKLDDPRILDFGVCRLTMHSELTELTKAGLTLGSPYYMSLEQFEGARDIDSRADVYSLGVILYEGFAGRRPFEALTLGELTSKIASGQPPQHLSELRPDLPKSLSQLVMRAISRSRTKRPVDVATFISELKPYLERLQPRTDAMGSRSVSVKPEGSRKNPKSRSRSLPSETRTLTWRTSKTRAAVQIVSAGVLAFVLTLSGIRLVRLWSQSDSGAATSVVSEPLLAPTPTAPASARPEALPKPELAPEKPRAEAVHVEAQDTPPARPPSPKDAVATSPIDLDTVTLRPPARPVKPASVNKRLPVRAADPAPSATPSVIDTQDPYQ